MYAILCDMLWLASILPHSCPHIGGFVNWSSICMDKEINNFQYKELGWKLINIISNYTDRNIKSWLKLRLHRLFNVKQYELV